MKAKKLERALEILKAIKSKYPEFKILDGDELSPKHIRVEGFGDVWPATGTYRIGKEYFRNNPKALLIALGQEHKPAGGKPSLSQRVQELEEYCAWLENRLSELEARI